MFIKFIDVAEISLVFLLLVAEISLVYYLVVVLGWALAMFKMLTAEQGISLLLLD